MKKSLQVICFWILILLLTPFFLYGEDELEDLQITKDSLQQTIDKLEKDNTKIRAEIKKLSELDPAQKEIVDKVENATKQLEDALQKAREIEYSIRKKSEVLRTFDEGFKTYWAIAPGASFPEVKTKDGQVLQKVTIHQLGDSEIKVKHSEGLTDLAINVLPDNVTEGSALRPDTEDMSKLATELFGKRPNYIKSSPLFAKTIQAEALIKRHGHTRLAQKGADRERALLEERAAKEAAAEAESMKIVEHNNQIDAQVEAIEKQIAGIDVKLKQIEADWEKAVSKYKPEDLDRKGEAEKRAEAITAHDKAKDDLAAESSRLSRQMLELLRQKK